MIKAGFWSLLRSWLRPHRGIAQEKLPLYWGSLSLFTTCENEVKRSCAPAPSAETAGRLVDGRRARRTLAPESGTDMHAVPTNA